jgi:RND family efflux transporter MFP subunit
VDERTLLRLRRLVQEGKIQSRRAGAEIKVLLGLSDELDTDSGRFVFPHQGTINFSDNKVDPSTGTLRLRAVIENPKAANGSRFLSPGLYMHVRLPVGRPRKALLIAEQAVGTDQGRKFVYVVNSKNEAVQRAVKVGSLNVGRRVIEEGLAPGEKVIVSGIQRVRPGAKVDPKPFDEQKSDTAERAKPQTASGEKAAPREKSAPIVARERQTTTPNLPPRG